MKPHDWGFVRVLNDRNRRLMETCWRCGLVTVTDPDGLFRMSTKDGQRVSEDCDEVILREVHST